MLWKKDEGFFLADMLLSLAAFVMAAAILLPMAIFVIGQTIDLRKDEEASTILYDELMYLKIAGEDSGRNLIILNGTHYEVTVSKNGEDAHWEVCVQYESARQHNQKCSITE
jgi:competence protein ComGE